MPYVATVNIPGYLPQDDDPAVFDTAKEAWEYLIEERNQGWNATEEMGPDYDPVMAEMGRQTEPGTVYGSTPGYEGSHDLGLAYSVSLAIECDCDMSREKVTCGACGRSWCDKCTGTHGPRCPFEYDHPAGING